MKKPIDMDSHLVKNSPTHISPNGGGVVAHKSSFFQSRNPAHNRGTSGMEGDKMSYGMKAPVIIEAQLTADELGFANQCAEQGKSLQSLLNGGVSVKIFRRNVSGTILPPENSDPLVAEFRWKNRELVKMRFVPLAHLPECTEVTSDLTGLRLFVLYEWALWFSRAIKPAVRQLIERDVRTLVDVMRNFDGDSARAIEEVLRKLHPEWYGLDC